MSLFWLYCLLTWTKWICDLGELSVILCAQSNISFWFPLFSLFHLGLPFKPHASSLCDTGVLEKVSGRSWWFWEASVLGSCRPLRCIPSGNCIGPYVQATDLPGPGDKKCGPVAELHDKAVESVGFGGTDAPGTQKMAPAGGLPVGSQTLLCLALFSAQTSGAGTLCQSASSVAWC